MIRVLLLALLALGLPLAARPARVGAAESSADAITAPRPGAAVSGQVEVRGTAGSVGPSFRSYRLEVGAGAAPGSWQPIGPERDRAVTGGVLGLWDTGGLAPGPYTLRLRVFDEGGHETESRVTVSVAAAPGPTAATPTAAPTAILPTGSTPAGLPPATEPPVAESPPAETPPPAVEPQASAAVPAAEVAEAASEVAAPPAAPPPAPPPPAPGQPFRCPMLYYHEVPGQAAFAAQVAAFLQAGYRPVTMGRLVDALGGRAEPPPGCLVLTFDDALASQLSGALPVLLRFQVPATFFVMPYFQDRVHRYMTPDDLRALRDAGMEIGSHTLNHATLPVLLRLNFGAFQSELVNSKRSLERELGQPVDLLAYPNGAWDVLTADEVRRAGYRAAASTLAGGWQRPEEFYWLRRFRADPWEAPGTVLARLRG